MLSQLERWINAYQLTLESRPQIDVGAADLRELLGYIQPLVEHSEAVKVINADTAAIRLSALSVLDDHAEMLVQFADTTVTDPAFSELTTGDLRIEPKLEGEGIAVSAHLVVGLDPTPTGRYMSFLEYVPGLPGSRVAELIRHLLRNAVRLEYEDGEDGAIKTYRIYPRFDGLLSQRLEEDLEEGYLSGIELYQDIEEPAVVDGALYYERRRVIKVKVPRRPTGNAAANIIDDVRERYRPLGFNRTRVQLRTQGHTKGVEVPPHLEQAQEAVSIRQHRIQSATLLPQCAEAPNPAFLAEMVALFDHDGN